jgi:hypothetical protein
MRVNRGESPPLCSFRDCNTKPDLARQVHSQRVDMMVPNQATD